MMKFSTLMRKPAEWMQGSGEHSDIVITSRIRFARNLRGRPFPGWAKKKDRSDTLEDILPKIEAIPLMKDAFSEELCKLDAVQKQALVERHLVSREHAAKSEGSAAVMNRKQSISIMINEEDHLRMQSIRAGLDLDAAYQQLDELDSILENELDYAFDNQLGYLTACPSNLGTGMRASVMLHLPALVLTEQINQVIQASNKIGLAVRGIYGEGTEAMANLFQVSNQTTLGERETEILARLHRVIDQIIGHEHNARQKLLEDQSNVLRDHIGRAYGLLTNAWIIQSKEALNQLSMIRLGMDLGFFPVDQRPMLDLLLMEIQPAHLKIHAGINLQTEARDLLRAKILRGKLKLLPEPVMMEGDASEGT